MVARDLDRAIDGLARRQHGAFHRRQAVRKGATRYTIEGRLGNGRWVRLAGSDVFALPSHPGTWLRQAMAATLCVPDGAVAERAAAALHRFPGFNRGGIPVVTRRGTTHDSPFGPVRESTTVGRFTVVEGIRVVSRADCLVQLAPLLGAPDLDALLDDVAGADRHLLDAFRERYVALAHSRIAGIGDIRAVLAERGDGYVPPRSVLERRLRSLFGGLPSIPTPTWEATPPWWEPGEHRVDGLIEDWNLIVEADGRRWHTRVRDFERDRWRDNEAAIHGHHVMRFSFHQLTRETAECRRSLVRFGANRLGQWGAEHPRSADTLPSGLIVPAGWG
jgi:hypothetical protein